VIELLEELMENDTAGDPMGKQKKHVRKSTRSLKDEFNKRGINICPTSVKNLLNELDYSLRVNRKTIGETKHPDRNQQFNIIEETKNRFRNTGEPIISVDSKKKELIGNFKNNGVSWSKMVKEVLSHDFRSQAIGIGCPFGIYELIPNLGTVIVGTSHDTPLFAVESIEIWLKEFGWNRYPQAKELLILCDSGGSNGFRPRLWKYELYHRISKVYGISIQVCHYPSGASKWNPVEHKLFSFISKNWEGYPLESYEVMLNLIAGTKTKTGLEVAVKLNDNEYQRGIKITENQMKEINLTRNTELPQWNYTIYPN
jgi:hypothetical protein